MGDKIKGIFDGERQKGHDFVGLYFFSRKAFLPIKPSIIKDILIKDFQHFYDRGKLKKFNLYLKIVNICSFTFTKNSYCKTLHLYKQGENHT